MRSCSYAKTLGPGLILILLAATQVYADNSSSPWVQDSAGRHYFAVLVSDLDQTMGWYKSTFGLSAAGGSAASDGSYRIENLVNDFLHVELIYLSKAQKADRSLGFFKSGFYVPDVESIAKKIEDATGQRPSVVEFDQLSQKILLIKDPEGNRLQFMSPLNSK